MSTEGKRDKPNDVLGVDKNSGLYTCPECGQVSNPGCPNCFHARYKGEDPLQPNPEAMIPDEAEK